MSTNFIASPIAVPLAPVDSPISAPSDLVLVKVQALLDAMTSERDSQRDCEEALVALGTPAIPALFKALGLASNQQKGVLVLSLLRHGRSILPWMNEFCLADDQPQLTSFLEHHLAVA